MAFSIPVFRRRNPRYGWRMLDLTNPRVDYVLAAYAVAAVLLLGLLAISWRQAVRKKRALQAVAGKAQP